jgi:hypothetical protein
MQIRYDHGADAVLTFKIRRHDTAGVAINPPVLEMVDERNGERWRLTLPCACAGLHRPDVRVETDGTPLARLRSVCRDRRAGLRRI